MMPKLLQKKNEDTGKLNDGELEFEEEKDTNELFKIFKEEDGKEYVEAIQKNVTDHNQQKEHFKELSATLETVKNEINKLKEKFDKKQGLKTGEDITNQIIDDEEFTIVRQLKDAKKNHKNLVERLRIVKSTIAQLSTTIKSSRVLLYKKFEEYLKKKYNMTLDVPIKADPSQKSESKSSDQMDCHATAFVRAKQKFNLIQQARKEEKTMGSSMMRRSQDKH